MANPSNEPLLIPSNPQLSEDLVFLLSSSHKILKANKRPPYIAAYRASRTAFLQTITEKQLDQVVAWLWEQGIERQFRDGTLGWLRRSLSSDHIDGVVITSLEETGQRLARLWETSLTRELRENVVRMLLGDYVRSRENDKEGFKKRGEAETQFTRPAAEQMRTRLKIGGDIRDVEQSTQEWKRRTSVHGGKKEAALVRKADENNTRSPAGLIQDLSKFSGFIPYPLKQEGQSKRGDANNRRKNHRNVCVLGKRTSAEDDQEDEQKKWVNLDTDKYKPSDRSRQATKLGNTTRKYEDEQDI
jgi:hypothetical protein